MSDPFLGPYAEIERLRRRAFEVLGVPEGAGREEVKRAFRSLALQHHPDVASGQEDFTRIVNAYLILTRPDPRGFSLDPEPEGQLQVPAGGEAYFRWWKRRFWP